MSAQHHSISPDVQSRPLIGIKTRKAPEVIHLVRHGESNANVSEAQANEQGKDAPHGETRDADSALSERGQDQARCFGDWLSGWKHNQKPTIVFASPYVRAHQTCTFALEASDLEIVPILDERLREREYGVYAGMTPQGIRARFAAHPEEADQHKRQGKFYWRPPAGESWADVCLRLRSFLDTLAIQYAGHRVMIFTHSMTIQCFRYVLERMTEEAVIALDNSGQSPNCGLTSYSYRRDGQLVLDRAFFLPPGVEATGARNIHVETAKTVPVHGAA